MWPFLARKGYVKSSTDMCECEAIGEGMTPGKEPQGGCAWVVRLIVVELVNERKDPTHAAGRRRMVEDMHLFADRTVDRDYIADCFNWANKLQCDDAAAIHGPESILSGPDTDSCSITPSEAPAKSQGQSSLAISETVCIIMSLFAHV
jgi:hypothetical protein